MLKDVRHCLAETEALGASFSLAQDAERLYAAADADGFGEQDFAAIAEVVRRPTDTP
jgi:3-hydroxyisobutyrate dehydrogenase-like beta-hydroxyacid dehydrogenase